MRLIRHRLGVLKPLQETPQTLYHQRRTLLQAAGLLGLAGTGLSAQSAGLAAVRSPVAGAVASDPPTPQRHITSYNNFYEFGTDKADPARLAHRMQTLPWTVRIEGAVRKPATLDIDALLKLAPMEDRLYRLRCVEGWSMVVPWIGYSLAELLRRVEPTGQAKFVEFISLADPAQMPGLRAGVLDWPYREALRLDEAMHPLTLLAFGLYGERLPNQNGAPLRLVVPWKYGFKSAKSLVAIRLVEAMPRTSWMRAAPREYGFYANVNPQVPHPRWSQATERRLGEGGLLAQRRATLPFNGYAEQVASLYAGMDLARAF